MSVPIPSACASERSAVPAQPMIYASFSQEHQQSIESTAEQRQIDKILAAVQSIIEEPENASHWKSLTKGISHNSHSLFGVVPLCRQELFVKVLQDYTHMLDEELALTLLDSNIFHSQLQMSVLSLLSGLSQSSLIQQHLQQLAILTDEAFVAYLNIIAHISDESIRSQCLCSLLSKSYSPSSVALLARDELSTEVVLDLLLALLDIYKTDKQLADNALLLLSTLVDAHCNHLIWNQEAQTRFRETAKLFNELTMLSETMLKFDAKCRSRKGPREEASFYTVKTISLSGRKVTW